MLPIPCLTSDPDAMSTTLSPTSAPVTHSIARPPRVRDAVMVFLFALACFSFSLGAAPLAGTEGHRAITAHQMVQRGSYLIPTLYGYTYLKKPPLHYWILAG